MPRLRADDDDDVLDTKAPSSATFSKATLFTKGGRRCFSGRRLPAKASKVDDDKDIFEEEEDALLLRVPPPFLAPRRLCAFCVGATTTKGALVKAPP